MRLADYVLQRVSQECRHVFHLPGGGSMHLVDALGRTPGLTPVCCLHEQACAVAAEAYAQATGGLGVCLVTTGPGGTNALTGVAAAYLDSTPLLVISGQVKRADLRGHSGLRQKGFQELPITRTVEPIVKTSAVVTQPEQIRGCLDYLIDVAKSGRPGPVWLDVPLDVQATEIDPDRLSFDERGPIGPRGLPPEQVAQVVELLRKAERPVLLLGNGMRRALPLLPRLLDALPVPVLLTWRAADFLGEDHPLYVGRPGAIGQRGANFAVQNADLLLSIGARCDPGQTGYNSDGFAFRANRVVVDIDPYEANKLPSINDPKIVADAGDFIEELLRQLNELRCPICSRWEWLKRCGQWKERYPVRSPGPRDDGVCPYALVEALSEAMVPDDLLVPGSSGQCSEVVLQAFRVKAGQRVLNSPGLGAMGFGVPAAIGACLATGRRTICVEGDGGFCMNAQELATVARLQLPIKFFVLNNGGYGSIRETQRRHFEGRFVGSSPESGCTLPDIYDLARSCRIEYYKVQSPATLNLWVHSSLNGSEPCICEVRTADVQTQPRVITEIRDGVMVTSALGDLWPHLPRAELEEAMR